MPIGSKTFQVELVTPHLAEQPMTCTFAALPAWDGEIGVLHGRSPLVCKLGAGELRVEVDGAVRRYYIQGGFAEVLDGVVTVLTGQVMAAEELSADQASADLAAALAAPAADEPARERRREQVEHARARLAVARRAGRGKGSDHG
ncbi:MAG: ATP synthase epsilon chain [Phycisphaerae bacterium]|nr:ATP synthase epsilon chain [Phycisphaerae bacterium]